MEPEARQRLVRAVAPVAGLALICALVIGVVHDLTGGRIAANREARDFAIIRNVMPLEHDNDLLHDAVELAAVDFPGAQGRVSVFRARRGGDTVGLVFFPVAARGYSGRIELAVGVARDGTVTGVRVHRQHETEGLGDRVHQSRSDWILQFSGRSLTEANAAEWAVAADGGGFDQISGATITPRVVINAVRATLEYYRANRDSLLAPQ